MRKCAISDRRIALRFPQYPWIGILVVSDVCCNTRPTVQSPSHLLPLPQDQNCTLA